MTTDKSMQGGMNLTRARHNQRMGVVTVGEDVWRFQDSPKSLSDSLTPETVRTTRPHLRVNTGGQQGFSQGYARRARGVHELLVPHQPKLEGSHLLCKDVIGAQEGHLNLDLHRDISKAIFSAYM